MSRWVLTRILGIVPVLFMMSVLVFFIVRLIPGDPAAILAGPGALAADIENVRRDLGLDKPLLVQYRIFMANALRGDLGRSIRTQRPVTYELASHLPPTVQLAVAAVLISSLLGLPAGIVAAVRQYSLADTFASLFTLIGISTPVFWLGLILQLIFAVQFDLLPLSGSEKTLSLVLPAVTLGAASAAIIMRLTRACMLEVLNQDYVRTARAKGLRERIVLLRHALKNALIPVVTAGGLQFGYLLGGAVITETVFAWPGLGRLLVDSIANRDYALVQGIILFLVIAAILVNLAVDLIYSLLDPKVRYE